MIIGIELYEVSLNAAFVDDPPFASPQVRTILVVEDNVMSRSAICTSLRDANYKVIEAASDSEAIAVLKSLPVDLVFVDLHLPSDAEGLAIAEFAKVGRPEIKVIFTSGRLREEDEPVVDALGIFIAKPYLISRVLDLVRTSFAGTGEA